MVMHDVGGNFGTRGAIYPEFVLVAWAARRVGRPVKWTCERHEVVPQRLSGPRPGGEAELALDADGSFLAMRGSNIGNAGAHHRELLAAAEGRRDHVQHLPHAGRAFPRARVVSNTTPTRPYRSSGRPEVMFVMERLIDLAARQCGFDRVELRRRNLLTERRAAVHQSVRHGLRQRRLSRGDGSGAGARRLAGFRRAPRRSDASAASAAASASPTTSTPRPAFRASAPRSPCSRTAGSTW